MTKTQKMMYDTIIEMTTEMAVDLFLNVHGTKLLDDNMLSELTDLGLIKESED